MSEHGHTPEDDERRERLASLTRQPAAQQINPAYSKFIRWMKLALPLVALIITAVVFTWSNVNDDNLIPPKPGSELPKTVGKNELLNPRFESVDNKKQPYTITAARAVQGSADENLITLEKPFGDMQLNSGNKIRLEAEQGSFRQSERKLMLQGNVSLFHDKGYTLTTPELNIDLENNTASSGQDVTINGPSALLHAKGLQADNTQGYLVFNGPADLTLTGTSADLKLGNSND